MSLSLTSSAPKLRADHLARPAWIYVRQSTLGQVRENWGSTARQYDLVQRARELGWAPEQIHVIDQDQARSGTTATGRDGFQDLVATVGLGQAGAVLSLEVSRLARNNSDWYRLLEICALTDTLVIDEDGVYDPGQYNDRLLLGIKGTMSEAELHWLRLRLLGGKLEKAQVGQLRQRLPAGLVYDPSGQVVWDPDEQVQAAIRLALDVFEHTGSALAVVKHFAVHHLLFPTRLWGGAHDGELVWRPLQHGRMLALLHNPAYAGAYVYGRTKTRTRLLPGEVPRIKGVQRRVARTDWAVVLPDVYPSYLTWTQYQRNLQRLDDNRTNRPEERRGAIRSGTALLQGIVLCGRCGRRMSVRYLADGAPCYTCAQVHKDLAGPTCQWLRGDGIDAAVAQLFLAAMHPAQLEISLATLEQVEARGRQIARQWQLRRERAQYEAEVARRRFCAVEPENRLVARTLEREWNEKLAALEVLEREYASLPAVTTAPSSPQERSRILALAQDVPAVWHAPSTTAAARKQLLRLLIKDVTLTRGAATIRIGVRWQTEALSTLEIPRPARNAEVRRTDPAVVARIRTLAPRQTDQQIAALLAAEGRYAGMGGPFTTGKVQWIRHAYGIPTGCPESPAACPTGQRSDGRYTAKAAAALLNIDVSTVAAWCEAGLLDAIRGQPQGPRWIALSPEQIAVLRKPAKRRWTRHTGPAGGAAQEAEEAG
jgi:DNA invertase Pin-like site-specific DNA recombinase